MIAETRSKIVRALEARPKIKATTNIYTSPDGNLFPQIRVELDRSPRYHRSFSGNSISELTFRITIVTGSPTESGVDMLDEYLSPGTDLSVPDALTATTADMPDLVLQQGDYDPELVAATILVTVGAI